MATTITINEALVPIAGVSLTRALPANVLNLDIQITSSDWTTLSGSVDFLIEVRIGGVFQHALESTGVPLGQLGPKGTGLPHFAIGANFLGPADQIRITAKPTTAVHLGLVVLVG